MIERDSTRSWALVGMLCAAHSLGFVDRVVLSVATPAIMKELDLSPLVAGVLLSAFSGPTRCFCCRSVWCSFDTA
ncbi:MAG: hypothetical protein WDO24_21640 [Pseudomonadota bacterium]